MNALEPEADHLTACAVPPMPLDPNNSFTFAGRGCRGETVLYTSELNGSRCARLYNHAAHACPPRKHMNSSLATQYHMKVINAHAPSCT
eukprot:6176184-Pleurochrysis_carterae.AAC.1